MQRHSRFTSEEDPIIVQEVCAVRVHIVSIGETWNKFKVDAVKINTNVRMGQITTCKTVKYRDKRIPDMLDKTDRRDQLRSGVGGKVGEMDELLLAMRKARGDLDAKRNEQKSRSGVVELEKERAGTPVVNVAMKRRAAVVDI